MSIQRQFGSGVAWMATGNWIEQAVNFVVFVLLARLLGAESFGLLAMAGTLVVLAEFLVRESFSEYLISVDEIGEGDLNTVFWLLATFGVALSLILFAMSGPMALFFGHVDVKFLMQGLLPTVFFIALTAVPVAILRRKLQFKTLALRAIAGVVVGGAVGIWMALNGYGIWALVGQRLAQVATNIIMAWAAVDWRPGMPGRSTDFRKILRFGGDVVFLRAGELARAQVPIILIGYLMGPVVLGLFSVAWRLVEVSSFLIITPLRMVSQPAFAAIQRGGEDASRLLIDILRLSSLAAFPAFFGLSVLSGPALVQVFGGDWFPAREILSVLSFLGIHFSIEKMLQAYCLARGRAVAIGRLAWLEVGISAIAIVIAAPFGVAWATFAYVATLLIIWPLRLVVVSRISGVAPSEFARVNAKPFVASLIMAAAVMILLQILPDESYLLRFAAGVACGVAVFALLSVSVMRDRLDLAVEYFSKQGQTPRKRVK